MQKIAIITIYDNDNYGNRLQNYATQEVLKKEGFEVITIKNHYLLNKDCNNIEYIFQINKNINTTTLYVTKFNLKKLNKKYDLFICGSDQVWNPEFRRLTSFDLLEFADDTKKVAFAASFGTSKLDEQFTKKVSKSLKKFKNLSVREDAGKRIVENLTGRKDCEVLLDPTMLLEKEEWEKIERKPKNLDTKEKYILNYFLGKISDDNMEKIKNYAQKNNYKIINILDRKDPYYNTGPSEFLYLEHHAELICTDSFHSCVFAILYNRPFYVFDRVDNKIKSINSRIDTLLNKLSLQNRKFNSEILLNQNKRDKITEENLEIERSKAFKYIKNVLKNI